jgi:hypothetical protein
MWRPVALSAASIALAALVWMFSPDLLDWIGLGDFDPLDRVCLVFLILSLVERAVGRWQDH